MFEKIINKYKQQKTEKECSQKRKQLIKNNKESELIIHHHRGCDRGGLVLISYDIEQLKSLKSSLENRGNKCILFENFCGGQRDFKFNLIPQYMNEDTIENGVNKFLRFTDRYFGNGRPIPNSDFFNNNEKEILNKWYKNK